MAWLIEVGWCSSGRLTFFAPDFRAPANWTPPAVLVGADIHFAPIRRGYRRGDPSSCSILRHGPTLRLREEHERHQAEQENSAHIRRRVAKSVDLCLGS